jgi:MFS family permease
MFLRTILNTAHRMVYPFLSTFARGLGVDITTMSYLMTARSLIGATSPFFAPIADRRGRRFGMLTGLGIFTLGIGMVAIYPNFYTLAIALMLAMLGKYMFDPSMQAYFGDRIP